MPFPLRTTASILFATVLTLAAGHAEAQHTVTVRLQVPSPTAPDEAYYLTAEHQQWKPADSAYRFARVADHWELRFPYRGEFFLQYRITRGSESAMESTAEGFLVRPRLAQVTRDTVLDVTVAGWADRITRPTTASPNVALVDAAFRFPSLGRAHRIWAYLPTGYGTSTRRYPVVYLLDGESLFDRATTDDGEEWQVDETLDAAPTPTRDVIVIGIEGGARRVQEYLPYRVASGMPASEGRAFVHDLVTVLMPAMQARFRIAPGRAATAIGGSSMGALIALFAALEHPTRFGGVAFLSRPQWPGLPLDSLEQAIATKGGAMRAKVLTYAGGRELGPEYVASTGRLAAMLARHRGVDVRVRTNPAGEHRARDWRQPFAEFAAWWLAPPEPRRRLSRGGAGR
jgi:predicted alpha/beta superfamily hydrolase